MRLQAHHDKSDQQLVRSYLTGDEAAFSEIVRRHRKRLFWVARRYAGNDDDAHDILQEAFLRASRNLHNFRSEAALSTWLHRLVMNSGYDFAHHRSRREIAALDDDAVPHEANITLSHDPVPRLDLLLMLRQALDKLRPDQCIALLLVDLGGYNVSQVARFEGVRPGTIKSRRGRAKKLLRKVLGPSMA